MKRKLTHLVAFCMAFCMVFGLMAAPVFAKEPAVLREDLLLSGKAKVSQQIQTFDVVDNINGDSWALLYLTNLVRMQNGRDPLSMSFNLQYAANIRAAELKTLFDHTRPDGTACYTALEQNDIPYETAGENIAGGTVMGVTGAVDGWWNSEGHRDNMLNEDFTHVGTGHYYDSNSMYTNYWVQLFTGNCVPTSICLADGMGNSTYFLPSDRSIDELGLILEVTCPHGTSYMPVTDEMCTGLDRSRLREYQTIQINYKGKTTDLSIWMCENLPFVDVPEEHWGRPYIETAYYNDLMTGKTVNTFAPDEPLVRAQFAVIVHRMMDTDPIDYSGLFPDVQPGQWYTEAIEWAARAGIITGYTHTGMFGPNDRITREQMAVMMYRLTQSLDMEAPLGDYSQFDDARLVSSFAVDAMRWAVGSGIITGKNNGTIIDPQGNATRAECAAIITRFIDYVKAVQQ